MTDEVRIKLASLPGLAVIARSSSDQYKRHDQAAREIAEELWRVLPADRDRALAEGRPGRTASA